MKPFLITLCLAFLLCLGCNLAKQESDSTTLHSRMNMAEQAMFGDKWNGVYPQEEPLVTSGLYAALEGQRLIIASQEQQLIDHQAQIAELLSAQKQQASIIGNDNVTLKDVVKRLEALDGKHVAAPAPPADLFRRVVYFTGPNCEPCHKMEQELRDYFVLGGADWTIGPGPENQIQTVDTSDRASAGLMRLCGCKVGQALPYYVLLIDGKAYKLQIDGKSVTTGVVACDVFCNAAARWVK